MFLYEMQCDSVLFHLNLIFPFVPRTYITGVIVLEMILIYFS